MQVNRRQGFGYFIRFLVGAVFVIVGFNFSNTTFFNEYPLFGVKFLAEVLISIVAALIGFFLVPKYFLIVQGWLEGVVSRAVFSIASDFFNQYISRIEESRKKRQKEQEKKKKENKKKEEARDKMLKRVKNGLLLDTSVLVDGRVLSVAKSGFLLVPLVIPKFVIDELHRLSDSKDNLKRKKGRRGLDMINKLKKASKVVVIGEKDIASMLGVSKKVKKKKGKKSKRALKVDQNLVELAKVCQLKVMTLDFNLNKVAKTVNVKVLNLNDLIEAVKPEFIPGEKLKIKITQRGKEKGQGIGYLKDGTMIVVKDGNELIGKKVEVVVSKLIQSSAGKIVFCEIV